MVLSLALTKLSLHIFIFKMFCYFTLEEMIDLQDFLYNCVLRS